LKQEKAVKNTKLAKIMAKKKEKKKRKQTEKANKPKGKGKKRIQGFEH